MLYVVMVFYVGCVGEGILELGFMDIYLVFWMVDKNIVFLLILFC